MKRNKIKDSTALICKVFFYFAMLAVTGAQTESSPFELLKTYDFGQDAAALDAIEKQIREAPPRECTSIEQELVGVVASPEATFAGKQFACRMLRRIGTEICVPTLAPLLPDKDMSHMARYVLEAIPGREVDKAFLEALSTTEGEIRIGIINSLGERKSRKTLRAFADLLKEDDAASVAAALRAIGRIGERDAAKFLLDFKPPEQLQPAWEVACVECAGRLQTAGDGKRAARLYRALMDQAKGPAAAAALRGLLLADPGDTVPTLLDALKQGSASLREAAAGAVSQASPKVVGALIHELRSLDPRTQVVLVGALAAMGEQKASGEVAALVLSEDAQVSIAAARALGRIGDQPAAEVLLDVSAGGGVAAQAAFDSLCGLRAEGVNELLIERAGADDADIRRTAIEALAARRVTDTMPQLLEAAVDPDSGVRGAALEGLGELAGAEEFADLVRILVGSGGDAAVEKCVSAVYLRSGNSNAPRLIAASENADGQTRLSVLRVLGRGGGDQALAFVRSRLTLPDGSISEDVLRILCDWPDPAPARDLLQIGGEAEDMTRHVLALRGCIEMAAGSGDAQLLVSALKIARRPEEKKLALSALGNVGNAEAMEAVMLYAADEELFREAALAAATMAEQMAALRPGEAREWLESLLLVAEGKPTGKTDGEDAHWRKRIDHVLSGIPVVVDSWLLAGPYTVDGKGGKDLMGLTFPPEPGQARNAEVSWQRIDAAGGTVDLMRSAVAGANRAAYLQAELHVPADLDVMLELGSDDGIKAWLNESAVHENNVLRGLSVGEDKVRAQLKKGENTLLLKITQAGGGWAVSARIVGAEGHPLRGLRICPE